MTRTVHDADHIMVTLEVYQLRNHIDFVAYVAEHFREIALVLL